MSYLKSVGTAVIYISLFLAAVTFLPGLPPDVEFREYNIVPAHDLDPKVGPKNRLHDAERLYVGEILGMESFESYNGKLYSGILSGYVVRLEEDHVVPIIKFGEKCDSMWQEHKCGRPLGLKFDKKGNLYVVDTYYGIFQVNMATKEYKIVVNISKSIDGKIPRLANSLDIAENGDIYWSHSSTDFHLYDAIYAFLANPSGRLIRYNAATKKNEVLLRNLAFANGVKLSDDESFVIVAESLASRIIKYYLKGPKAGQQEIFVEGLPGFLDNIHTDSHGGFLVCAIISVNSEHPQLPQSLPQHPYLRKMFARLLALMETPFKLLQDIYPNVYAERLLHSIGSLQSILPFFDTMKISTVLRIDASGNVIEALISDDGTISFISSAYVHNGYLWLGSPWNSYVMRIPLKQAFPDLVDNEERSIHVKNEKQPLKVTASDIKSEKVKRNTDSTKAIPKKSASPTITSTISKPISVPTTTKPIAASKESPILKSTNIDNNAKSSETKPTSKSANTEVKKEVKTINDTKSKAKSNLPNMKSDENSRMQEDAVKISTKSEKNAKMEQDIKQKKQKSEFEKVKSVETNRPKNSNKK